MQDLLKFNIELMQNDPALSWLFEQKECWNALLTQNLRTLLEGNTFVLFCDHKRNWFERYFLSRINSLGGDRPFLPFYSLSNLYPNLEQIKTSEEMALLSDLLSISFPNGFTYFYIGEPNTSFADIAKTSDESYIWLIGEDTPNMFCLESDDKNLDIKLIKLFEIFNKSIDAALFNEVII